MSTSQQSYKVQNGVTLILPGIRSTLRSSTRQMLLLIRTSSASTRSVTIRPPHLPSTTALSSLLNTPVPRNYRCYAKGTGPSSRPPLEPTRGMVTFTPIPTLWIPWLLKLTPTLPLGSACSFLALLPLVAGDGQIWTTAPLRQRRQLRAS